MYHPDPRQQAYRWPGGLAVAAGLPLVFGLLSLRDNYAQFAAYCFAVAAAMLGVAGAWAGGLAFGKGIRRHADAHLGPGWADAVTVSHPVLGRDRVNLQRALDAIRAADPAAPPVFGMSGYGGLYGLVKKNVWPVPLQFTTLPTSATDKLPCADNALYFLRLPDGRPFLALVAGHEGRLEVLALDTPAATAALDHLTAEMGRRNVYRGAVLSVEYSTGATPGQDSDYTIRFHDMPPVARDQIVLPADVMAVVERNVIGLLAHAETLRKAGRSTRHGVLLHGPPGTGKTLVTRYLARACPDYTVVLLTGRQLNLVRESCHLAKLLAPAVVVLEDVDLIAVDRERSFDNRLLHDLMDEMDGLGAKADVIFLLTTNRPRALEAALAARPGRVDQAIYFPLPDRECRRRLFGLYGVGLDLAGVAVEPLLDRTDGASPAFVQELFRKAALFAAERGERADPLRLTDADFEAAVGELIGYGGALTRNLLGYRSDPDAGGGKMGFVPAG